MVSMSNLYAEGFPSHPRIVFMGTPDYAVPSLEKQLSYSIILIIIVIIIVIIITSIWMSKPGQVGHNSMSLWNSLQYFLKPCNKLD